MTQSPTLTPEDRSRLRALAAAATPGPWAFDGPSDNVIIWSGPEDRVCFMTSNGRPKETAAFLCAARADFTALLDLLDAQDQRIAGIVSALTFYKNAWTFTTNKFYGGLEYKPKEELLDDCGNRALEALAPPARAAMHREDGAGPALADEKATFQARVQPWMMACFGPEISADKLERNDRFIEEALELVQASGYPKERAYALVDYVYGRDQGDINQEVGGVMVTLAAHCLAHGVDMHVAAETELARIWTKVEQIRAKQAAKPKHSPLPVALPTRPASAGGETP